MLNYLYCILLCFVWVISGVCNLRIIYKWLLNFLVIYKIFLVK